jgi:hypothetical protein
MQNPDEIKDILIELRDTQREHLAEYKKAVQRSIELQERAVKRQEQLAKTNRFALIVSAVLITGIIGLIFYLLSYMPARYR